MCHDIVHNHSAVCLKVEQSELVSHSWLQEIIMKELGKAYRFHCLCVAPIKHIQQEFTDLQYQPRDYLEYQVSSKSLLESLLEQHRVIT